MLAQEQIVDGLTILEEIEVKEICKDCMYGKHTACLYDSET